MPEQLNLLGIDTLAPAFRPDAIRPRGGQKLRGYTLFLAIFPEQGDAQRLSQKAAELRSLHELAGTPLSPERLHITLLKVDSFTQTVSGAVVDASIAAATRVVCRPLPVVFDQALSFPESQAFVLRCGAESDAAVARLRQSLAWELRRVGLHPESSDTPHMTTLYNPKLIAAHPIVPICWTATRFALILSHVGLSHHQWVRQWNLAG